MVNTFSYNVQDSQPSDHEDFIIRYYIIPQKWESLKVIIM